MKLRKQLEKLGLSSHEAKVYLATLELPNGSVVDIAKRASIAKSTAHDVLGNLLSRGLVHKYIKNNRARFTAGDPQQLLKQARERHKVAEDVLPELAARFATSEQSPRVQFYQGEDGVTKVFDQIINEADQITCIASPDETFSKFSKHFPEFPNRRAQAGIPIRIIFSDSPKARERVAEGPEMLRTWKLINTDQPFGTITYIWNNKVALITFRTNLTALVIENKDIIDSYKLMFETLWNQVPDAD